MKNGFVYYLVLLLSTCYQSTNAQNQNARVRHTVDSLTAKLNSAKNDAIKLKLRYAIGTAGAITRIGYWDSLVADIRNTKLRFDEGKATQSLGYAYLVNGLEDKALICFNRSSALAMATGNNADLLPPLLNISHIFYRRNEIKKALDQCYKGLQMAEEMHDTLNIANFYLATAVCYFSTGEIKKSINLNNKALGLYRRMHYHRGIAESLIELGSDYLALKQEKLSSKYYLASKQYIDEFADIFFTIEINNSVGSGYCRIKQYDSAYKYSSRAYKAALQTRNTIAIASIMTTLAGIMNFLGNTKEAEKMSLEALQLLKTTHFTLQVRDLTGLLEAIYSKQHNYKKALEAYKLYVGIVATLSNADNKRQAIEKEFQYDLEKKESENKLLAQQNKIQSMELAGMGSLIVLVLIITWLFFRQHKLKNEQSTMQLEQKLLRSQMNPHFIFNSLQAIQNFILKEDKKKAEQYLGAFAGIMRNVLDNSRMESISLKKEISLLESYLQLQALRFVNRFNYTITTSPLIDVEDTMLPPMLCQPFIENAIEHGFHNINNRGNISIAYTIQHNRLVIEISDNGIGIKDTHAPGKRHRSLAIEITRERIALLNKKTGNKASFSITEAYPHEPLYKGVKIIFSLPLNLQA